MFVIQWRRGCRACRGTFLAWSHSKSCLPRGGAELRSCDEAAAPCLLAERGLLLLQREQHRIGKEPGKSASLARARAFFRRDVDRFTFVRPGRCRAPGPGARASVTPAEASTLRTSSCEDFGSQPAGLLRAALGSPLTSIAESALRFAGARRALSASPAFTELGLASPGGS